MAKARKTAQADLPAQRDPAAPLDAVAFLRAAQPVLRRLTDDLLVRADASPHVTAALKTKHTEARAQHRTAEDYVVWRRAVVTQVAAAWLLSCVFIRVLEDRGLIHARLAGAAASDSERTFFQFAPSLSHREYLLLTFRELTRLPAAAELFDSKHNLVWRLAPSDAACKELLQLFRGPSIEAPAFRFGQLDTRFLGDLYQDIDADTREFYALLQTPDFVESFILDHTLEPAIREYGIDNADLIDPTCGSGHFLLGAFPRFLDHLRRAHPAVDDRELARRALDKIFGVDINPYAASIARFRLFLAFVEVCKYPALREATTPPIHVVPADSLLYGFAGGQGDLSEREEKYGSEAFGEGFNLEDAKGAREILAGRRYTAVVGNPPYITVKDSALREKYRDRYTAAAGKYALSTPFMERFFALGKGEGGYIGQITSNSFMKREFGKALIEKVLRELELTYIVNTSGAFIPGHGTPTVIIFGRNRKLNPLSPRGSVRAVLAKRGEPGLPSVPAEGAVWRSIIEHDEEIGFDNEYISIDNIDRAELDRHPWALEGGGAGPLKSLLEQTSTRTLGDASESIGISSFTLEDDVYIRHLSAWTRTGLPDKYLRIMLVGEAIRDWGTDSCDFAIFPYGENFEPLQADRHPAIIRALWPWQSGLANNILFGGKTKLQSGLFWYEYGRLTAHKLRTALTITYAEVATHNHFVLDRGGNTFKQTAPIIKLASSATEDDHLALIAFLNSSTACFWMKHASFNKGSRGQGGGLTSEDWEQFYQFSSTRLEALPLPPWTSDQHAEAARRAQSLLKLADERQREHDLSSLFSQSSSPEMLATAIGVRHQKIVSLENRIRAEQESLDWWIYGIFGLSLQETADPDPPRAPGDRLSDIIAARTANGACRYFQMCRLPPPTEVASSSLDECDPWISRRARETHNNPYLKLLETPVYKRTFREGFRPLDTAVQAESWLADAIETALKNTSTPLPFQALLRELPPPAFRTLEAVFPAEGARHFLHKITERDAVPFLSRYRYNAAGFEKHAMWRQTWHLQRHADELEAFAKRAPETRHKATSFRAGIAVPPRYDPADYRDPNFYRLRGKLDVPKERFISYPGCASDVDLEPVYGWAGWDHLQRALALFQLYYARKDEAWKPERLLPMLAGLEELLPWVRQWHAEARSPETGQLYHEYFDQVIASEAAELGFSRAQLATWAPPERGAGRKSAKSTPSGADDSDTDATTTDGESPTPKRKPGRKPKAAASSDDSDTDAPATDGEPAAPKRKPGRKPKAPAAADGSDPAPARTRKSKSADKTPPPASE